MFKQNAKILAILFLLGFNISSLANDHNLTLWTQHPLYIGITGGWGSTDWSQVVVRSFSDDEKTTLALSAPTAAGDCGLVVGAMIGYEVASHFAFEANYMHFPTAKVVFDENSIYNTEHNIVTMHSHTFALNVLGKVLVPLGSTSVRGFIDAGPAIIHREDPLVDTNHVCPTFGIGIDYTFHTHFMWMLAFQYYAGFGQATLRPAINDIPFLYTFYTGLSYRF
jgi:hypothetical protein